MKSRKYIEDLIAQLADHPDFYREGPEVAESQLVVMVTSHIFYVRL